MQRSRLGLGSATLLLLALVGCQQSAPETATQTERAPTTDQPAESAPVAQGPITLEPANLASCDIGAELSVKWDVRVAHPEVTETEIWTGSATPELTLFAASGPYGEAKTGAWASPGSIFAVRDRATGKELARAVVQGPSCE